MGSRTIPVRASCGDLRNFCMVLSGCLSVSKNENLEVSRTSEGLPSRAEMYDANGKRKKGYFKFTNWSLGIALYP